MQEYINLYTNIPQQSVQILTSVDHYIYYQTLHKVVTPETYNFYQYMLDLCFDSPGLWNEIKTDDALQKIGKKYIFKAIQLSNDERVMENINLEHNIFKASCEIFQTAPSLYNNEVFLLNNDPNDFFITSRQGYLVDKYISNVDTLLVSNLKKNILNGLYGYSFSF